MIPAPPPYDPRILVSTQFRSLVGGAELCGPQLCSVPLLRVLLDHYKHTHAVPRNVARGLGGDQNRQFFFPPLHGLHGEIGGKEGLHQFLAGIRGVGAPMQPGKDGRGYDEGMEEVLHLP